MRRSVTAAVIAGACALVVAGSAGAEFRPAPGMGGRPRPGLASWGAVLAAPDAGGRVARHPGTGLVTYLPAEASAAAVGPAAAATAEGAARAFVGANAGAFGIADAGAELRLHREIANPAGGTVVRYRQLVGGVPVFGGEVSVAVGADRRVRFAAAETIAPGPIALEPAVTAAAARDEAVAATAAKYALPAFALAAGEPELQVYDEVVFFPELHTPGIVWRVEVATDARPLRELVLVDARRGGVRLAFNQIDAAKDLSTHTMGGSDNEDLLPGTFVCDESNLFCPAGDTDAQNAHRYASDTYDYFNGLLKRDGIDGAGMTMVSSVHFGVGYLNAFWSGAQMVYGDGFSQADDVVGHELAHGVMQYTANLYYWAESGAINESYSDLYGEFVDQWNGDGDTLWLMGEDVPGFGALRNMANPPEFGDPDRIGSPNYFKELSDNAGVHYNSGVNNKAVWMMAAGGAFNGQTVAAPLGNDKVAYLYYSVQAGGCLTEAANYNDLANCLRATCDGLAAEPAAGMPTLTAGDCAEVRKAITAVEMDSRPGQRFVDDSNAKMTFKGTGWTAYEDPSALYATIHESEQVGDTARVKFSGSRLAVHTWWWYISGGGVLDLYLDSTDKKIGSINQATNTAGSLHLTGLPSGTHTLIMKHAKGAYVSIDAVNAHPKAVATPAFSLSDYLDGQDYSPWRTEFMTYKGAWSVWPGWTSYSSKVGDTATFSFTGNAFVIGYLANTSNANFGGLQIYRDDKLVKSINTQFYDMQVCGSPDIYDNRYCYFESTGFTKGKHTVKIKHSSGQTAQLTLFGAYDLTQP